MAYERCMGLHVTDEALYARYRAGMQPILAAHHGRFRYDLDVAAVRLNEEGKPINRVFVISFATRADNDAFFLDLEYQQVRNECFKPSVDAITLLMSSQDA